jgi:putative endonuclease
MNMDISAKTRKEVGNLGEELAALWLSRQGFRVVGRNIARKTGELDVVAQKGSVLHIVEVKTVLCAAFPDGQGREDRYGPADNLHAYKIRKVARTAEWYVADIGWEGEWQLDGMLVWLRADGRARVSYLPQVL